MPYKSSKGPIPGITSPSSVPEKDGRCLVWLLIHAASLTLTLS